ncbi:hypothetical protein [Prevotella sp.]|uniref:hypothetical protein n=1 Tax=Prevotella sp. TaxID=59823 RepID=UPI0027E22AE3|nr:hypothetical protein [Prevotella sp.]
MELLTDVTPSIDTYYLFRRRICEYQERTGIDLMHLCFEQLTGNQIRSLSATFLVMAAHHSLNLDASLSLPNE